MTSVGQRGWREALHPRDRDGKFATGGSSGGGRRAFGAHLAGRTGPEDIEPREHFYGVGITAPTYEHPTAPGMLPYRVLDQHEVHPFGARWQSEPHPEARAGGFWSDTYQGMSDIRKVMRNRAAGRPWNDGLGDSGTRYRYTLTRPENAAGEAGKLYSGDDVDADLQNAATVLQHRLDHASRVTGSLWRGMLMNRDQLPAVGDEWHDDISSWTDQREWAEVYQYAQPNEKLGIVGDHNVLVRMVGSKRAANIDDIVGSSQAGSGEHLARGTFRVRKITRRGRRVLIHVEQINDEPTPAPA